MEPYRNWQEKTAEQISALYAISNQHQSIITSNTIIQQHIKQLMEYLRTSSPLSRRYCNKIINYLLAEIQEPVEYERPSSVNQGDSTIYQNYDHLQLKNAMEEFYSSHLKPDQ